MNLEELYKQGTEDSPNQFSEKNIILFDHVGSMPHNENFLTEAYVALLCLGGKAECRVHDRTFEVVENDVFLCQPNLFIENAMMSLDFKCRGMLMTQKMFENFLLLGGNLVDAQMVLIHEPVIHLDASEVQLMVSDFDFLDQKMQSSKLVHHKEIVQFLLQAMVYEFFDCIAPKLQLEMYNFTSAESLYSRFIRLVVAETPRHRDVKFYASQLCITSKYLCAICKQQSDLTASTIINRQAVEKIKQLLRTSPKSVKEIAVECGFENLSFFGKYVRRELGMSPRDFRRKADFPCAAEANP